MADDPWKALIRRAEAQAPSTPAAWPGRAVKAGGGKIYPFEDSAQRGKILQMVEQGYPPKAVCASLGVSTQTFRNWQKRALAGEEPFVAFFHELETANEKAKITILGFVRAAAEGAPDHNGIWKNSWQAGRWLLQTQWPDEFTETKKIQVETSAPRVAIDPRNLSDEELDQLRALLEKGTPGAEPDEMPLRIAAAVEISDDSGE